jgi:hypothetical protein
VLVIIGFAKVSIKNEKSNNAGAKPCVVAERELIYSNSMTT